VFKEFFHGVKTKIPVYKLEHMECFMAHFIYILTRLFGTKFAYMEMLHAEEKHIGIRFLLICI
jgi:hypothetical protein